ncbi:MAG: dCTP deaminase [Planctomycetia bacterium]|nr:dCTP deaminase [Planctomycetia bacterium]
MILSGLAIKKEIQAGSIVIDPFNDSQLNPNSYNLRLHDKLLVYRNLPLDIKKANDYEFITIPPDGLILYPGQLYLGRSLEYTRTDRFVPMLEGRSSMGRLGLCVHITAGFGDVGFAGFWTLEIHVIMPVRIYPEIEICQIYYHTIEGDFLPYKNGKYQNNTEVQPSMSWKDFAAEK